MTPRWQAHDHHILDTAVKIRRIQKRGDLTRDEVLYDATLRNLQTRAESTQHLPDAFKTIHADVPWREISGFRNILVHSYLGEIDPTTVLDVVRKYLHPLETAVRSMLDTSAGENE